VPPAPVHPPTIQPRNAPASSNPPQYTVENDDDDDIVSMLQDENNRLKDRIRAQDAELEAIDAQMLDTQEELETLELTHSSYCDDYEAKEIMYKKSIQELNVIASSSNANVSTMLQSKEKAIEQLQNQLGSLESSHEASISYVRQQLEDVSLENETLEAKCLEYKGQSRDVGQGRAHIINELRDQLSSL
jgi:predicted  nucleic acid-binding Zn-ribbon protein